MNVLPRLLIIDDLYGRCDAAGLRDRRLFCSRLGVEDISGDDRKAATVEKPVAAAVLSSGQKRRQGRVCNDLEGVVQQIRQGWRQWPRWSLVMVDLHFQTGIIDQATGEPAGEISDRDPELYFGLQILERILSEPDLEGLPMVILSAMERERIERRFARRGIFAFVDKELLDRQGLQELLWEHGLLQDECIVAQSLPVLMALRGARRQSRIGNANMLLLGETGTGKELVAEYLHRCSGRDGPFRKVFVRSNDDMFASDLFGYVKGAFTGAVRDRVGEAEEADGGTLFLDEFGDIPAGSRDKLMRLLDTDTRESQRIGDSRIRKLDLQVVMATNRFEILQGGFRRDLLQRANAAHPIVLPPLRERCEDIPLLAEFFVRRHERRLGAERRDIAPETMKLMQSYFWPGNVRELDNEMLKAVASYRGIRYLAPGHLELDRSAGVSLRRPVAGAVPVADRATAGDVQAARVAPEEVPEQALTDFIRGLAAVQFPAGDSAAWAGKFTELQGAYARLLARYLEAALAASTIATGKAHPTTAMRMLLGRQSLRTSDAAGAIKRLLSVSREAIADMLDDESLHLGKTLRWAENLRRGGKSR